MLEGFVDSEGFTSDEAAARQRLEDGELDIVVIFPPDPLDSVLAGERAEIEVLHDKLDPIQEVGVVVSAELAVQRVNASVLSAVVAGAQTALAPVDGLVAALVDVGRRARHRGGHRSGDGCRRWRRPSLRPPTAWRR